MSLSLYDHVLSPNKTLLSCLTRIRRARISDRGPYLVAEETVAGPSVRAGTELKQNCRPRIAMNCSANPPAQGRAQLCKYMQRLA